MLNVGKLDSDLLEKIVFQSLTYRDPQVLVRPGIGKDCGVVDFGPYECIVSSDPITAATEDVGRLAVHISCNDIATGGIKPVGLLLTILLPPGTTEEDLTQIMAQVGEAGRSLEVEIIGGHTEVTPSVNQPVIVTTAFGKAAKKTNKTPLMPGDGIFITKSAGLEGGAIIAAEYADQLEPLLSREEKQRAREFFDQISVVPEGLVGGEVGVSAMHDITEGGVLGSIWEMCQAQDLGAEIDLDRIPVEPVVEKLCDFYHLNPYRLISSGSMMILVPKDKEKALEEAMTTEGIACTKIGAVQPKEKGILCRRGEKKPIEIDPPGSDELYKVIDLQGK